jgi:dienelactone hydrolase
MSRTSILLGLALALTANTLTADPVDWPALTQKPNAGLPLPDLGLRPLLRTADGKPVRTPEEWSKVRARLRDAWRERLGKPPARPDQLDARVESTEKCDGYVRQFVSFHSAGGDRILAYLLIPAGLKPGEKRPAVVVFHPTVKDTLREPAGLGPRQDRALGVHLVLRGYVVLCPQCFIMKGKGPLAQSEDVGRRWPGLTGLGKMTFDASRCVDYLQSLAFVDGGRIGCIGHSLGAKEVLFAMAFEPRYRVGVFNEGGIGLRMSNWTDPWYLTREMKAHIPALENHQVLALAAPRPVLVLGGDASDGDGSWPFVHAALPVYRLLGAGDRVGLVNHHGKHSFPRAARRLAYRWLDHWLAFTPVRNEVGP